MHKFNAYKIQFIKLVFYETWKLKQASCYQDEQSIESSIAYSMLYKNSKLPNINKNNNKTKHIDIIVSLTLSKLQYDTNRSKVTRARHRKATLKLCHVVI